MKHVLLIEELTPTESDIIVEQGTDQVDKQVYLTGVLMQSDIKNRNGRNYPLDEITREVDTANKRIQELNGIFGELDHPQTLTVNLERISHVITELKMDRGNAVGRLRLLETPMGKIGKELINSGVRIGVSSRGAGQVADNGIVSGFNFVTVDIVATPSAPGAMPESVYESLMEAKNGPQIISLAEEVRNDPVAQKYLKKEILKFLDLNLYTKKNG